MFDAKLAHSSRVLMSLVDAPLGDLGEHGATGEPMVIAVWQGAASGVGEALAFPTGHAYETKLAFQVRDANGRLLLRSDSGPDTQFAPLTPGFADVVIEGAHWRTFTLRSPGGYWYQSGELADIRAELAEDIAEGTLLPLLVAIPLMAVLVWGLVGWSLQGLLRVSAEVEARAAHHLEPLKPGSVPKEVHGLVAAINGLLARLDASFQREGASRPMRRTSCARRSPRSRCTPTISGHPRIRASAHRASNSSASRCCASNAWSSNCCSSAVSSRTRARR